MVALRAPWLVHEQLDVIVKSGALRDRAVVLDLMDHQRALVRIDGRFSHVLPPVRRVHPLETPAPGATAGCPRGPCLDVPGRAGGRPHETSATLGPTLVLVRESNP